MVWVRWGAVAFSVLQILTYYRPHPPGVLGSALALAALLAAGNAVVHLVVRRAPHLTATRALPLVVLLLDIAVVIAFVVLYTFDIDTAMWAVVYVLPLEGAIRFGLAGALSTMAGSTLLYALREVYGTAVHGNPFYATSISFRMGIGFIIAAVAGVMASGLVRERERVEEAKASIERFAAELEAANEDLLAASAVKDDFLAMTNHELRTPLTTILGYTTTLRLHWDALSDQQRRDFVRRVEDQGERLMSLVEGLLTLSSAQAGGLRIHTRPIAVGQVVAEAIQDCGQAAAGVVVRCPGDLGVVADPFRLRQVVTNYLANALKYGQEPIDVEAQALGDQVEIRVADHGPGVPEDFVPELFDRFTRASGGEAPTGGAGLGLAIVRKLIEAQGGEVWYEPNTPAGACFCLRLPRAALATLATEEAVTVEQAEVAGAAEAAPTSVPAREA